MREILATLLVGLAIAASSQDDRAADGWRGLTPLHSTRSDVESLLGRGAGEDGQAYYLPDVNVFFVYSSTGCKSGEKWDIPQGTVLRIIVYPKPTPRWSDLKVDKSTFVEK